MSTQSYIFDFQRVPSFFDNWNIQFKLLEMNDSNNFQLVFSSYAPSNISECLSGDVLSSDVTVASTVDCSLKWTSDTGLIQIRNDATWSIGDSTVPLKAVFLRHKSSGYVMGYSINMNSFEVTNTVTLEADTILWSISDE